ncbi:MazG family protein [Antrihabitans sp. YC3-6]|uniref:MazG family protein n=1 Tax=Antrihabitans stalagmiti TaxID=2799499 RepID=A0A934NSG0_9NOCA|nr:MazG family protein [Antrihabitans stalagmiti]MBJ8340478.1 MazG family protein [Antrihabitans stalagmiti]
MTVILLDPLRPTLVPLEAVEFLGGPVQYTVEVPVSVRWRIPGTLAPDAVDAVLISTDPRSEAVLARISNGENVIAAPSLPGDALLEAVDVMDRLWGFGGWEVTQSHDSLRPYLLEETYELLDAIGRSDAAEIKEELGDLLLQVLFHSRIAQAAGDFVVDDVAATLVAKLSHRSPHLGDTMVGPIDVAAQEKAWENQKASEKARRSCVDGIAMALPALALAEKVRSRSAKAGLPDDLVPETLKRVEIGLYGSAEEELRKAVLAFVADIRAAEDAAEAERGERRALFAKQWHRFWPTSEQNR